MPSSLHTFELDPQLDILQTLAAFEDEPFLLLLDSAAGHRERDSRYSVITADPVAICRIQNSQYGSQPFQTLREWQRGLPQLTADEQQDLPPFCGGIAGLMSYELGQAFERLPSPAIDDFETPALLAGLFDWAIVWDHIQKTVRGYVLSLDYNPRQQAISNRADWIAERLNRNRSQRPIESLVPGSPDESSHSTRGEGQKLRTENFGSAHSHRIEPTSDIFSDFTRWAYVEAVARVIEYIRAGDIFQANLSQRLMTSWSGTAIQLYSRIRRHNPAPFCGLLKMDNFSVVSASPERFLKLDRSGRVETRPIKGTRRRPRSAIADLYAGTELAASEKDRAENIMIVDLLRNDISRTCRTGTVRVTGLCEIERFETVLHLVSTVGGQLRPDCDVWDLMAGCFPGGSITGAPKIRAMQIIADLEPTKRGAYCGSLFTLGPCGDFDSSILIRTFTLKDGWVQFPVGGGIVADSDPLEEYRETLHKASGMIRALKSAKQG